MFQIHKLFLQLHRIAWAILLFNLLFWISTKISFTPEIVFGVKMLICLSGALLFFFNIRPFRQVAQYYAIYLLVPLFIWLSWLIDGIMFAVVSAIPFMFVITDNLKIEKGEYAVYQKFTGFLTPCCVYEVIENKFFLFNKRIINIDGRDKSINFSNFKVISENNRKEIYFQVADYDNAKDIFTEKDTSVVVLD